ncbi:MAG: SVM family protein [Candidatus Phytoplasma vitis]|nr:MAG: SVM family protein [Candidatus Phytoplasma vitis]
MFKLKKQLFLFKIVLFVCLGLLFVINNNLENGKMQF